jgi:heme exporter protein A
MPIIKANNIGCQRGVYMLFEAVSFELDAGQSLLISGPNGIGKTTLLESIAGLRALQQGSIHFNDIDLSSNKELWFDQSLYIGHKTGNKKELNCLENVRSFLQIQGIAVSESQAEDALENVGLAGFEYQMAGSLSAGQKKRLALARLLLVDFPIWILDEPFVNLDVAGCDWLMTVLDNHINNEGLLIITAHDNKSIRKKVTQELVLESAI